MKIMNMKGNVLVLLATAVMLVSCKGLDKKESPTIEIEYTTTDGSVIDVQNVFKSLPTKYEITNTNKGGTGRIIIKTDGDSFIGSVDFSSTGDILKTLDFKSSVSVDFLSFNGCYNLSKLDISKVNTSRVTDMSDMFCDCNLAVIDVSNFDTSNVSNMSKMFARCAYLSSIDVSNFNTSLVTDMSYMFQSCESLKSLDLSNFNTSNVLDMSRMFETCYELTNLDVSSFNTSKVVNMQMMFNNCNVLENLDVTHFNTSQVTDMSFMFQNCESLKSLDLSSFNTENVNELQSMFYSCSSLNSLDISHFNLSNVKVPPIFEECIRLMSIWMTYCNYETIEKIKLVKPETAEIII